MVIGAEGERLRCGLRVVRRDVGGIGSTKRCVLEWYDGIGLIVSPRLERISHSAIRILYRSLISRWGSRSLQSRLLVHFSHPVPLREQRDEPTSCSHTRPNHNQLHVHYSVLS